MLRKRRTSIPRLNVVFRNLSQPLQIRQPTIEACSTQDEPGEFFIVFDQLLVELGVDVK
jgi:hypothetical protein